MARGLGLVPALARGLGLVPALAQGLGLVPALAQGLGLVLALAQGLGLVLALAQAPGYHCKMVRSAVLVSPLQGWSYAVVEIRHMNYVCNIEGFAKVDHSGRPSSGSVPCIVRQRARPTHCMGSWSNYSPSHPVNFCPNMT